ncbi:MAG: DUF1284 domain-containing protein [Armatimonadia bacterium]
MRARPHHLIDIITQYGAGSPFEPCSYGHAVHTVAAEVIANPDVLIEFGIGADDICAPCVHLVNGRCDDLIRCFDPPVSKHEYNDDLDQRVLRFLGMQEGEVMTFRQYTQVLRGHLDGLAELCSHPGEEPQEKHQKLAQGLEKLGA